MMRINKQKNDRNTIEARHVRLVRLIEKDESQATKSEHERCSQAFHDVLAIDTPGHERARFLVAVFIGGGAYI